MEDKKNTEEETKEHYGDFAQFVHESKSKPLTQDELVDVLAEIRTGETVNIYAS